MAIRTFRVIEKLGSNARIPASNTIGRHVSGSRFRAGAAVQESAAYAEKVSGTVVWFPAGVAAWSERRLWSKSRGRALLPGVRDIGLTSADAALCASSSAWVIGMLTRRGPAVQEVNNGT